MASALVAHRLLREAIVENGFYSDVEGAATVIAAVIKELLRVAPERDSLCAHPNTRISTLANISRLYREKLRGQNWVDAAEIYNEACKAAVERQTMLVYGYIGFSPDEAAFLDALAGEGSLLVLPYKLHDGVLSHREVVEMLETNGWQVEIHEEKPLSLGEKAASAFSAGAPLPLEVKAVVYPHQEAEVRGVLREVKQLLLQGVPSDEVVLVARDEALYGPVVLSVGWEYDLPVRVLYDVPLLETAFGAWFNLLLEVVRDGMPYETTLQLLSHPFAEALSDWQYQQARKTHPNSPLDWERLGVTASLFGWPEQDKGGAWIKRIQSVFKSFDFPGRLAHRPRDLAAYQALLQHLPWLENTFSKPVSLPVLLDELNDMLRILSVPAQPGRGGVELRTPKDLTGARYPYVFVLGMADGVLPASIPEDTSLDFADRAELMVMEGLPLKGIAQAAGEERLAFDALLQIATKAITLSYPKLIRSRGMLPSPYIQELGLLPSRPGDSAFGSLEEARCVWLPLADAGDDPLLPEIRRAYAVESSRESAESFDMYDGIPGIPIDVSARIFSVSQLTRFGQCPFRWFAGDVLKLAEPDEAETDLSALQRGNLYHKVLEWLAERTLTEASPREAMLSLLEDVFAEAEALLGVESVQAWPVRRAEHIARLRRVLQSPGFLPEGHRIRVQELSFESEWYGLPLKGKIDRVDETPEGLVFIDYKTSGSKPLGVQDEKRELKLDIQLPIYVQAASVGLFPGEAVKGAYYFSVTKGLVLNEAVPGENRELAKFAESFKARLAQGCFPIQPDKERKACEYCDMDLVCRQGARLNRKEETA